MRPENFQPRTRPPLGLRSVPIRHRRWGPTAPPEGKSCRSCEGRFSGMALFYPLYCFTCHGGHLEWGIFWGEGLHDHHTFSVSVSVCLCLCLFLA